MKLSDKIRLSTALIVFIILFWGPLAIFTVMWCWNYAVVYVWHLPKITWKHALCFYLLANMLIRSFSVGTK